MSPPLPAILAALSSYRTHISGRNRTAFSVMIRDIETLVPDDPDHYESDELEEARLEFTQRLVGGGDATRPPINRPSDVLTHWEDLVPQLGLDGACVYHDASWRDKMRDAYMRGVLRGLNERCTGLVTNWEFPADLAVVLQHVDSLDGPGWYQYREENETVGFLQGWTEYDIQREITEETAAKLVTTASEIIGGATYIGEEYEVAGGWTCGVKGNEAMCYAMYTRPKDAGKEQDWSWRYLVNLGQFGAIVFENMVEVLEWYKSYQEPQEDDWHLTPRDIWG